MKCGVPQGSVLGSTLWNVFYDGLLRVRLPSGASLIDFADDVVLAVVDHMSEGIAWITNEAHSRKLDTCQRAKTRPFKNRSRYADEELGFRSPRITVGNHVIEVG